jgi:DNA-binding transcriptional regulator YdaS (Cro superfamily)
MSSLAFKKALAHFKGNQSAFAKAVGTSQQRISYVARCGNSCPPDLVIATERATGISRHTLRPDLYPIEAAA